MADIEPLTEDLTALSAQGLDDLITAGNEVLDAMPVKLLARHGGQHAGHHPQLQGGHDPAPARASAPSRR